MAKNDRKNGSGIELYAKIRGKTYRIAEGDCCDCMFIKNCERHGDEPDYATPCSKAYALFKKDIMFVPAESL